MMNRPLADSEKRLIEFMLEHGDADARKYLPIIENIRVTPWKCGCGCASFNMVIDGESELPGPMRPIADFVFGSDFDLAGVFLFESGGVLAGLEVYGLAGNAPKELPHPSQLRPIAEQLAKDKGHTVFKTDC